MWFKHRVLLPTGPEAMCLRSRAGVPGGYVSKIKSQRGQVVLGHTFWLADGHLLALPSHIGAFLAGR